MAFQRKKPEAIGVKAPFPGFIEPELATSIDKVPSGERWIQARRFTRRRVSYFFSPADSGTSLQLIAYTNSPLAVFPIGLHLMG
jgi:hypothetical protein